MALIHSLYHDQQTKGTGRRRIIFKFSVRNHDLDESICNFISQIEFFLLDKCINCYTKCCLITG